MTIETLPPAESNGPHILGLALPGQEIVESTCFVAPRGTPEDKIQSWLPPQGIQPLELPSSTRSTAGMTLGQKFETPSIKPKELAVYRHDITRGVDSVLARTSQLDIVDYRKGVSAPEARDEALYGVELVASELLQNAMRYGGGIGRVDLGCTSDGKLYMAVRNLSHEFPKNTMHLRDGHRSLLIGSGALHSFVENTFASDEHGRGIELMSRFSEQAGIVRILCPDVPTIPVQDSSEVAPIKEVAAYAILGKPKPGMSLYGLEMVDLTGL